MGLPSELEKFLQDKFPGCVVKHINNVEPGDLDPAALAELDQRRQEILDRDRQSLRNGVCGNCGAKYPGEWPPPDEVGLAEGWGLYTDEEDEPVLLVCPCDDAD